MNAKVRGRQEYREWLDHILKRRDWTGTELAKRAGLAPSTILRPMNNETYGFTPSLQTIAKISQASGCKPSARMLEVLELRDDGFDGQEPAERSPHPINPEAAMPPSATRFAGRTDGDGGSGQVSRRVKLMAGDGLALPETCRTAIGVKPSDMIEIQVQGDELRIRSALPALRRLRARIRAAVPEGQSVVDELIAERRAEAARG